MLRHIFAFCALLAAALALQGCGDRGGAPGEPLALDAPLPEDVPPGVTLVIGDPVTQAIIEYNGWEKDLPFKVEWAQLAGGPQVTEAFHARALDVGSAANVPPIHAVWVGIPVKIVGVRLRDGENRHPSWRFGISPKTKVDTLADLRGKRIAFSAGQVQGEVVLRTLKDLGIATSEVTLVDLPSTGDVYINALAAGLVDAAPLGASGIYQRYLRDFAKDGAKVLDHGHFRDDLNVLYVREDVLKDAGKAAALRAYIQLWARATRWSGQHREELADFYYRRNQGLSLQEALQVVRDIGPPQIPSDWSDAIAYQQGSIELLAQESGRESFDASTLFDRRFEPVAAAAFQQAGAAPQQGEP